MSKQPQVYSLLEVMSSIQKTIHTRYKSIFWVKAEMSKLNHYTHSGHCYPELVQKQDGKVIAQIKSTLWKDDYNKINQRFLQVINEPLKDGITILFSARISFDATHGLMLRIIDIDPAYVLGDLEREKQETILQLQQENIFHSNKKCSLALLPKRIAIISVQTSKGYADFLKVAQENVYGHKFFMMLFPALLQGEKAIIDILNQLERIKKVISHFDAVAIIRGGGGDIGLSCYNNFELAKAVATFPIPVITGIGHATNETVVEMVAYKNAITPTQLGDFLIDKIQAFAVPLTKMSRLLMDRSRRLLYNHNEKISTEALLIGAHSKNILLKLDSSLRNQQSTLTQQTDFFLWSQKQTLENIHKQITFLDPQNILKRGYSITLHNGKVVKSIKKIGKGYRLQTMLSDGIIESEVSKP